MFLRCQCYLSISFLSACKGIKSLRKMLIIMHRPAPIIVNVGAGLSRAGQSSEQIVW